MELRVPHPLKVPKESVFLAEVLASIIFSFSFCMEESVCSILKSPVKINGKLSGLIFCIFSKMRFRPSFRATLPTWSK